MTVVLELMKHPDKEGMCVVMCGASQILTVYLFS